MGPARREQGLIRRKMRRGVRTMEIGRRRKGTRGSADEDDGSKDVEKDRREGGEGMEGGTESIEDEHGEPEGGIGMNEALREGWAVGGCGWQHREALT